MGKKLLILGAGGMLGHTLLGYCSDKADLRVWGTIRAPQNIGFFRSFSDCLIPDMKSIEISDVLTRLDLTESNYFLISTHREENIDSLEKFGNIINMLNRIAEKYRLPVIVSTHPRTMKKLESIYSPNIDPLVKFLKPFGFFDYIRLQMSAKCVISNSGTIAEESSLLGFPAITIRDAHERPEGMDAGTLIMSTTDPENAIEAIDVVIKQHAEGKQPEFVDDYVSAGCVSMKVVRIVLSYIPYVRRTVWKDGY